MGKFSGKKKGAAPSEISFEMHSIGSNASTGGYRDAVDSEHDFEIGGPGQDEYWTESTTDEAVSDITAISRAIDEAPPGPSRSKMAMFLPCLFFIVAVAAVAFVFGRSGSNDGAIFSPKTRVYGNNDQNIDATSNDDILSEGEGEGTVIEFTVANLNTNAKNCTHIKATHMLECVPAHNEATNKFRIQLHPEWAPLGVERFEYLTTSSFWNGVRIFRIVPNFVSQFGISSDPDVQKKWESMGPIQDDPVLMSNNRGTVTFATSGENTRTSKSDLPLVDSIFSLIKRRGSLRLLPKNYDLTPFLH